MASPALERAKTRVGSVLREKWRLDKLLGVGGSAAVYQATHINNGKRAAVKVLHSELCGQKDVVTRFLKEGYFSNKIEHRGAVSVIDDDRAEDGSVYLVMELLEGHSLEKYVRDKERLTTPQVVHVVDEVLDLLAKAHDIGILHRDIKPANIYLTNENLVKVLDFGIARLAEQQATDGAPLTQTGTGIGTPSYMPPEQARGRWNLVDGRSDIFAVGAMMYALLLGHRPRKADTANEELLLAMTEPLPKALTLIPGLEPGLAEVVDRACSFDMEGRWPSARTMQQALRMVGKKAGVDTEDTAPRQKAVDPWESSTSRDAFPNAMPRNPPSSSGPPSGPVSSGPFSGGPSSSPSIRKIPDGPKYRVPEIPRSQPSIPKVTTASGGVAAVSEPVISEPSSHEVASAPRARSQLPSVDVEVDIGQVDMTPATPPPIVEPSQVLSRRPFAASTSMLATAFEPQLGFILLGAHAPKNETARYRAWVMHSQSVLWETFQDQPWAAHVKDVKAMGPFLFVVLRNTLLCLDLVTGQTRWSFTLPDKVEVRPGGDERGPVLFDFLQQGSVIVQAGSVLVSIDPMSGAEQWQRRFPGKLEAHAIEGAALYVVRYSKGTRGAMEILAPGSPNAVTSYGTQWFTDEASVIAAHVEGTRVVARVEGWGLLLANGILVIDVPTRRQVSFDRERDMDTAIPPQSGPNGAYYMHNGVLMNPANRRAPPSLSGHRYAAFKVMGTSVLVVLEENGTGRLKLLALDTGSLQIKHDFGMMFPPGQFSLHMPQAMSRYCLTSGEYVVFPAWVAGRVELRCVHAVSGQTFWSRPRQEPTPIDDAYMLAGHVVLRSSDSIEILEPKSGTLVARYGS
jgi:serine/threonine protein kinase